VLTSISGLANPKVRVALEDHPRDLGDLVADLVGGAEDVRVVLGEAADAGQAVGHAGPLVAVQAAEVGEADRELAVAAAGLAEQHAVPGAVHRLHAELPLVDRAREHVVLVVLVVTGGVEQLHVEDLRGDDLLVAVLAVQLAHVGLQQVVDGRAAAGEERAGRGDRIEVEQAELLAELAVVAGLRLLEQAQVLLELLAVGERGPVDALQHSGGSRRRASRRRRCS
jgi:hypothetical protein